MTINYPIIYEIAKDTYAVNEFGMTSFFILTGSLRGLVIDCGCGSIHTPDLIEQLCPLPYDVVITHAHGEHCGAMGYWNSVWIHPLEVTSARDFDLLMDQMYQNKAIWYPPDKRGAQVTLPSGKNWIYPTINQTAKDLYDFKNIHFQGLEHVPDFCPLRDGQIFDLGNRRVEVLHTPGHTAGHCSFLDVRERILFSGDTCKYNLHVSPKTISVLHQSLKKLQDRSFEVDRIFSSHTASGPDTAGLSIPKFVLSDCIQVCLQAMQLQPEEIGEPLVCGSVCLYLASSKTNRTILHQTI